MKSAWFVIASAALAAGCETPKTLAGEPFDFGSVGTGDAKQFFEANVSPILSTACASCHQGAGSDADGPNFLGDSASSYYASLSTRPQFVTAPGSSMLLLKGEHTGPAFTTAQASTVSSWLEQEAADGGGATTGGGTTTTGGSGQAEMVAFGDCMTIEDWIDTGLYQLGTQSTQQGPCMSCHQTGTGGTFIGGYDDEQDPYDDEAVLEGFETNREMWYILKLALWTVNEDGSFNDIVPAYRWRDKGDEPGQHPSYELLPEYETALDEWFDLTYARWSSGSCTP